MGFSAKFCSILFNHCLNDRYTHTNTTFLSKYTILLQNYLHFHDLHPFVAIICRCHLRTFSANIFGLKSRLRHFFFSLLECMLQPWKKGPFQIGLHNLIWPQALWLGNTNRAVYKKKIMVLSISKWASYHQMQSGQPVLFLVGGQQQLS